MKSWKHKKLIIIAACLILVITAGCITGAVIDSKKTNRVKNGDLGSWIFGSPSGWSVYNYRKDYNFDPTGVTISKAEDGSACIEVEENNDVRFYQQIKVKPSTYYKITASFKVEGTVPGGFGAGISIYDQNRVFPGGSVMSTDDEWTAITVYGVTGEKQESLELAVGLGGFGADSSGKIWIKDVSMEKISELPDGEQANALYSTPREDDKIHELILSRTAGTWIFRICVIATVLFVFFLIRHSDKKRKSREEEIEKGEWQPGMKLVNRKEVLLIAVMTLAYLLLAIWNLGDMKAPQTSFSTKAGNEKESIEISLGSRQSISRIMYNTNLTSLDDNATAYIIEYLDETGKYIEFMEIKASGFYKWHFYDSGEEILTDTLRITVKYSGLILNEIGFLKRSAENPQDYEIIEPIEIIALNEVPNAEEPSSIEDYEKWFDEQDTIVDTPSFMNQTYFDEIYFPRTAYENINNLPVYEVTHPPLGKLIQAAGILVFGMTPFGWRIMGTLFGAFMIPLMYLIAKKMFNRKLFAFMAAALMFFDTMHFAQTRLATIDSYTVVFIMLMYYFMYDIFACRSYEVKYRHYLIPLAFCGISFGFGAATKWICLYAAFGLAIIFFLSRGFEFYNYRKLAIADPAVREEKWYKRYLKVNIPVTLLVCIIFFIGVPLLIYCLSYIPYTKVEGVKGGLLDIVKANQKYMFKYHSKLTAGHDYSSEWWQWIIDYKPILYVYDSISAGMKSIISCIGNPVIWITGIAALFVSCWQAVKKSDKKAAFILIGYVCQLFPWMIVFRACFIYHYFSCLPFLILFIVYVFKNLYDDGKVTKSLIYVYIAVVGAAFCLFYPFIAGIPVSERLISALGLF